MKRQTAAFGLLAVTLAASQWSYADPQPTAANGCYWDPRYKGPLEIEFNIPAALHIAQDAPVGTLVGGTDFLGHGTGPSAVYECQNNHTGGSLVNISYNATNVPPIARLASGLPRVALTVPEDSIIETNIPGLGVSVRMKYGIDGTSVSQPEFLLQKSEARVPFLSTRNHDHATILRVAGHEYSVSLIKTGPIPAGAHNLDPSFDVVRADVAQPVQGVTTALIFRLSGSLVSSGCETAADPVTPNPVDLGEFDAKDFERPGAGSSPVRFELNLVNCQPPAQGTVPRVHLRLDPANGSTAIDDTNGLFSTGAGSTGGGVAFQVLQQDGIHAMPLGIQVPIMTLPTGSMRLPLNVKLVKHTGAVKPGTLTGALNFLLTYQ